jgi:DNA (cytosine-5)-methyltransferase 1
VTAYYNEVEPFAAQWLRNLIAAGHITPGEVDERSIEDVEPEDLRGFTQCHFFAGIGVWSYALRLAGWPDDRPVWTGSCPCQPFSVAGRQLGTTDERHLWPTWFRLIRECRPAAILGEQVAGPAALEWLDLVSADLEDASYSVGAADLCAASVGAPHIRQRLYWMGISNETRRGSRRRCNGVTKIGNGSFISGPVTTLIPAHTRRTPGRSEQFPGTKERSETRELGNPSKSRGGRHSGAVPGSQGKGSQERSTTRSVADESVPASADGRLANTNGRQSSNRDVQRSGRYLQQSQDALVVFWRDTNWLPCSDGKARPVEPGTFPLAHGVTNRVGRLRAYGNALCAPVAATFIKAAMETTE